MDSLDKQLKNLFEKLKSKSSEPSKEWLASMRVKLEQEIKDGKVEHFQPKASFWYGWLFKPATAVAVVLIVLLGGGTAFIAQGAEPGESLYPLKLVGENFHILIQVSPEAKAKLYMKYADRRLGEFEKIYEKNPDNPAWQEKTIQGLENSMVGAKGIMVQLHNKPEYAELALRLEEATTRHQQRLASLEQRLNTSTIKIINRAQELTDLNQDEALEALRKAQTIQDLHQERYKLLKKRLDARLEVLNVRQLKINERFKQKLQALEASNIKALADDGASSTTTQVFEETIDEDGIHVESRLEVEGEGSEEVDWDLNINNGQIIDSTTIRATGTTINIRQTQTIQASSSRSYRIDGREVDN